MNKTDKATVDAAKRMIKGRLPLEEINMLTGISMEDLKVYQEEYDAANPEGAYLKTLDFKDFDIGPIMTEE